MSEAKRKQAYRFAADVLNGHGLDSVLVDPELKDELKRIIRELRAAGAVPTTHDTQVNGHAEPSK